MKDKKEEEELRKKEEKKPSKHFLIDHLHEEEADEELKEFLKHQQ